MTWAPLACALWSALVRVIVPGPLGTLAPAIAIPFSPALSFHCRYWPATILDVSATLTTVSPFPFAVVVVVFTTRDWLSTPAPPNTEAGICANGYLRKRRVFVPRPM